LHGPIDTTAWRSYVFYKRAASASETNPLCDWTATSADKYAQVHTIRNTIKTGSPFAASVLSAGTADPGIATGVTSTLNGQLIVNVGIGADNLSGSMTDVTGTDPTTFTNRHYSTITTGADANGWFYTAVRATAGATGTISNNFAAAPTAWGVFVAAILDEPNLEFIAKPQIYPGVPVQDRSRW
jgi:hypothetical protein